MKRCLQLLLCSLAIVLSAFAPVQLTTALNTAVSSYTIHGSVEDLGVSPSHGPDFHQYRITMWMTENGGTTPIPAPLTLIGYANLIDGNGTTSYHLTLPEGYSEASVNGNFSPPFTVIPTSLSHYSYNGIPINIGTITYIP